MRLKVIAKQHGGFEVMLESEDGERTASVSKCTVVIGGAVKVELGVDLSTMESGQTVVLEV